MKSKQKETPKQIAHFAYMLLKESGVCLLCKAAWRDPDYVSCKKCRMEHRERCKEYYYKRKKRLK